MLNLQDYMITKLVTPNGKRLGAMLSKSRQADIYISIQELQRLGEYLKRTGQRLSNGFIGIDGRVLFKESKDINKRVVDEKVFKQKVKSLDNLDVQKSKGKKKDDVLSKLDESLGISTKAVLKNEFPLKETIYKDTKDMLHSKGLQGNKTELRVANIVDMGLRMARDKGLGSSVLSIEVSTPDCNSMYKVYMTISAFLVQQIYGHRVGMKFQVRMNGQATMYLYMQDMNVGEACMTQSYFLDADECMTIGCKTALDVCNVLCWYVAKQRGRLNAFNGYDGKDPRRPTEELNRYVSLLQLETRNDEVTNYGRRYDAQLYPHARIRANLKDHIRSLEQIRVALNEKYLGIYSFVWDVSEEEAVLSASKYVDIKKEIVEPHAYRGDMALGNLIESNVVVTDVLADIRLQLTKQVNGYGVTISHRVHDILNTGKWVILDENRNLIWLDMVCANVGLILDEIFQLGVVRGVLHVLACGEVNGKHCYLIQGYEKPITKEELLELRKYTLIDGIQFDLDDSNEICIKYDVDCYGQPLNKFGDVRGERFIRQVYQVRDEMTDTQLTLKTAVSLDAYMKLHKTERRESIYMKQPKSYIKGLCSLSKVQLNTLQHLSEQLKKHIIECNYTYQETAEFLLNFMRSFKYTRLADLVIGNRTPLETLVERHGCCLELSLLASILASLIGFSSALIIRYSPNLATKYHAVSSVRLHGFSVDSVDNEDLSEVNVCDYIGLEHTSNTHGKIGVANSWCCGEVLGLVQSKDRGDSAVSKDIEVLAATNAAIQYAKEDLVNMQSHVSQIVVLPIGSKMTLGDAKVLLYENDEQKLLPMQATDWLKIQAWFTHKTAIDIEVVDKGLKQFPKVCKNPWSLY